MGFRPERTFLAMPSFSVGGLSTNAVPWRRQTSFCRSDQSLLKVNGPSCRALAQAHDRDTQLEHPASRTFGRGARRLSPSETRSLGHRALGRPRSLSTVRHAQPTNPQCSPNLLRSSLLSTSPIRALSPSIGKVGLGSVIPVGWRNLRCRRALDESQNAARIGASAS